MQKETVFSILRTALTLVGSYIIGHNVFGHQVNSSTWQIIAGAIITATGTLWGIFDKTAGIEAIQSGVRSVIVSIGGLLTAAGVLTGETLDAILGLVAAVIPALQSHLSKVKVQQIASGSLQVTDAGKVAPAGPKIK